MLWISIASLALYIARIFVKRLARMKLQHNQSEVQKVYSYCTVEFVSVIEASKFVTIEDFISMISGAGIDVYAFC